MSFTHENIHATQQDILRAWTDRLYTEYENILFHYRIRLNTPLIRISELTATWGQWAQLTRTITLSHRLIERHSWDVVVEILKHEMAHQLVDERLGGDDLHGPVFRKACNMLGVADWAAKASGELPQEIPSWRNLAVTPEEERLLKRVEKLLSLAASTNEHEATLAMQRVRELYARHNLAFAAGRDQAAHVYCTITRKQKRIEAAESMIFSILTQHFFVRAVFTSIYDAKELTEYKAVELLGTRENVLMAEYVYHFLFNTVQRLWVEYRTRSGKGAKARRSYMLGVLSGFRDKLTAQGQTADLAAAASGLNAVQCRALIRQGDRALATYVGHRYPRLASKRWGSGHGDRSSFAAGVTDGGSITIHRGLTHQSGNRGLRLPGGKI